MGLPSHLKKKVEQSAIQQANRVLSAAFYVFKSEYVLMNCGGKRSKLLQTLICHLKWTIDGQPLENKQKVMEDLR